ncbi:MAG: hypothetical protein CSA72_08350 [Rhodobacterales bacterium]|nr:MAG: hypothetical protein CSA72_08350 [Rhodobacterales bacterium]
MSDFEIRRAPKRQTITTELMLTTGSSGLVELGSGSQFRLNQADIPDDAIAIIVTNVTSAIAHGLKISVLDEGGVSRRPYAEAAPFQPVRIAGRVGLKIINEAQTTCNLVFHMEVEDYV